MEENKHLAESLGAIPFDVPGVEHTHYENRCTFDYFITKHNLKDPACWQWLRLFAALIPMTMHWQHNLPDFVRYLRG